MANDMTTIWVLMILIPGAQMSKEYHSETVCQHDKAAWEHRFGSVIVDAKCVKQEFVGTDA